MNLEGLHGNVIGDTFRSSGKFGGSISFDGDNDAVVLPKVEFMDSPSILFHFNVV